MSSVGHSLEVCVTNSHNLVYRVGSKSQLRSCDPVNNESSKRFKIQNCKKACTSNVLNICNPGPLPAPIVAPVASSEYEDR